MFPGGSEGKASACNAGDPSSIPGLGSSPGEGNGNPLQYPCLENPMDGRTWWATVHGVAKSRTRLSELTSLHFISLSSIQQSDSVMCVYVYVCVCVYICIIFLCCFPYGLLEDIEYSSLHYPLGPYCLSILYIVVWTPSMAQRVKNLPAMQEIQETWI